MTPADRTALRVAGFWQDAHETVLADIARRAALLGPGTPGWQARRAVALAALTVHARRQAARARALGMAETERGLREAHRDPDVRAASQAAGGLFDGARPGRPDALVALARDAEEALDRAAAGLVGSARLEWNALTTRAAALVVAGARTPPAAVRETVDAAARRGLAGIVDSAGRRWKPDDYARMAVQTAAHRASVQGNVDRLVAQGRPLGIVSDSPRECPQCRPWEGRVVSLDQPVDGYPSFSEARAGGLLHPGCGHTVYGYTEGLTRVPRPGSLANPDGYAAQARQRALEVRVRDARRREAAARGLADGAGTPENRAAVAAARASTRDARTALKAHVDDHAALGLKRRPDRERA